MRQPDGPGGRHAARVEFLPAGNRGVPGDGGRQADDPRIGQADLERGRDLPQPFHDAGRRHQGVFVGQLVGHLAQTTGIDGQCGVVAMRMTPSPPAPLRAPCAAWSGEGRRALPAAVRSSTVPLPPRHGLRRRQAACHGGLPATIRGQASTASTISGTVITPPWPAMISTRSERSWVMAGSLAQRSWSLRRSARPSPGSLRADGPRRSGWAR